MKMFELFNNTPSEDKLDFDLQDDLIFYMKSDPVFYRKKYFPCVEDFKQKLMSKSEPNSLFFSSVVKDAIEEYSKKFDLPEVKEKLGPEDLKGICIKLKDDVIYNIKNKNKENL
jgi:hypothetical protein